MRRSPCWPVLVLAVLVPAIAGADDGSFSSYEQRGWGWMFLASFGFGFLTSLTPCVYPMVPITLAIFGARGDDVPRRRAIALASAYVGGLATTYTALGVTFALLGKAGDFGTQLGNPWIVVPLIALFLTLAASMFGAFDLNLPASVQARLNQVGGKGFGGAFAMGLVGGLIAAPCTGPFLAGLLAFVSTTGSVVGGGALLFTYGIGMGLIFWLIAAFALSLPKSGRWMEAVKSAGGIGLLFMAIYFLKPFLPFIKRFASPQPWFLAVAIALSVAGLAAGAVHLTFHGDWKEKVRKAVGVVLVLAGVFGVWTWMIAPKHHLPWVHDEAAAFERARREGKGVMVDFSAEWCAPCDELELTFGDPDVYDTLTANFVPLKFDVTESSERNDERRARYGAATLPSVVFMSTDGSVLARIRKMVSPEELLGVLAPALRQRR